MSAPLLITKLHMPGVSVEQVARSRLLESLNAGLSGKLSLISAPAGFGKTTLAANWIANALPEGYQGRTAWFSVDHQDNDLARFWQYLIKALQTIEPETGGIAQAALQASPLPPTETILSTLINEIAALNRHVVLGLDDYHEITSPELHAGLDYFIQHLPSNLHIVIVTREDPPFSLSRLRVRGQMTEIRAGDLRFSRDECKTFFNDQLTLALTPMELDALNDRTEGWAAGLQLAAISLREVEDKQDFIRAFAGSHRLVTDYLVDEVLSRQSDEVQRFLWRTAIMERFCVEVCDRLAPGSDSRKVLRELEQANLFLIPLDHERRWFRYHHLFAEFLRLRLYENEPEAAPKLMREAIDWFAGEGLVREALQYALRTQEFDRAADLIEVIAPEVLEKDNHMLVIRWIEQLPPVLVKQRAKLCVYMGWAWVVAAQMETAVEWLEAAEALCGQMEAQDAQNIRGHAAAHQAYIVFLQGNYDAAVRLAERGLELLPEGELALRARTITCLGNALNYCGRLSEAKDAFVKAIRLAKTIGSLSLAVFAYGSLGEVYRDEGRLSMALQAYQQLVQYAEELTGKTDGPLTGFAQFEIGVIWRERNELDQAVVQIQKGVDLCRMWQQGEPLGIGLLELAETHRYRGEFELAEAAINDAYQVADAISPWAVCLVEGFSARLALSRGDIESAACWAEQSGLSDEACEVGYERFPECLPLIRLAVASGKPERALGLAERLIERDRALGRIGRVLDLLVLKGAALAVMGKDEAVLEALGEALVIAAPEKSVRPFLDEGPGLVPYFQKLPISPHRDRLLEIFGHGTRERVVVDDVSVGLIEPLNEREISILKMMSVGRSNREIGEELYLSVNTIRWYASQIYLKLGVKSRGEAVARGREVGELK